MIKEEAKKVKKIDKMIFTELKNKLVINKENVNIVKNEELERILKAIEEKKKAIYLLFKGEFSQNEYNIMQYMNANKNKISQYDEIANNVILKRVELIFDKIIKKEPNNGRLISVCIDRQLFIGKILKENVNTEFIKETVEKNEIIK